MHTGKILFSIMLILIGLNNCFHYRLYGKQLFDRYMIFGKKFNEGWSLFFGILVVAAGSALLVATLGGIEWGSILELIAAPIKRLLG